MMKKTYLLFILVMSITGVLNAQDIDNNFYTQNPYLINPAFAGYMKGVQAFSWGSSSLQGIEGAPRSIMVGVQSAIERNGFGAGGKIQLDQRGIYEAFSFDFTTSYKLLLNNYQLISFGLDAGFINRTFNLEGINEYVNTEDPTLYTDYYNKTSVHIGAGIGYLNQKMQYGISFPRLVEGGDPMNTSFNAFGTYIFKKFSSPWASQPTVLIQHFNDGSWHVEGNYMLQWKEVLWGQLGYRSSKVAGLGAGLAWQNMELGYHFSLPVGSTNDYFMNTHELMLTFDFARNKGLAFIREQRKRKKVKKL